MRSRVFQLSKFRLLETVEKECLSPPTQRDPIVIVELTMCQVSALMESLRLENDRENP